MEEYSSEKVKRDDIESEGARKGKGKLKKRKGKGKYFCKGETIRDLSNSVPAAPRS